MSSVFGGVYFLIESLKTKAGQKGFVTALSVVFLILTLTSTFANIEYKADRFENWLPVQDVGRGAVLGFPEYQNAQYRIYFTSVGGKGGSLSVTVEHIKGWKYNGTFFVGDTIQIDDYRVTIKQINLDRASAPV